MYPVSELYRSKIQELERTFEIKIQIQHSQGVLYMTDTDIVGGTLAYTESSQAGEEFTIGSTVASSIEFSILNRPEYADIEFMGATVLVTIGLELMEGMNLTYEQLKQYTYEELTQFYYGQLGQNHYEYVPLGVFNIDDINKQRNSIKLKAIDNMINLDKPYSLSNLGYPATLFQIYVDICNVCDVLPATSSFPNMDYIVQERPEGDYTFRDMLGYVAELSGAFARMNRHGALELTWYKPTGLILTPTNRFNFKPRDDQIKITGIMATVDDTTYLAGTDEYAIDLTENPLLQGDYETVLPNIYNNIKDTEFTPFESNWQGNPAIQAGDMITQIDRDGKVYPTLVTFSKYKYRGSSTLKAEGLPVAAKGYKGSTNKKITNIIRKEIKPIGDQLTTLEQAQLHATQLIANMLGGYAIQTPEAFYVADNPDLQQAQKVWKFGLGGFGYSENGVDGPYETAITADGSIVAMLVSAGIVTADMIQTGELRSVDGTTRINLDNSVLQIFDPENAEKIRMGKVENNIYGMRANHIDGSYTQLTEEGLKRFVPSAIFEERPTGVPNFEGFESGEIPEDWYNINAEVISSDKRSGNYCLQLEGSFESEFLDLYSEVELSLYITKNSEMEFWYKSLGTSYFYLDGVSEPLYASSIWKKHTVNLTKGYHIVKWRGAVREDESDYGLRLDDITFEANPVELVPIDYETKGYEYKYRTYIGEAATMGRHSKTSFLGLISDVWIQLPGDFVGQDFEVFLSFKSIDSTSDYYTTLQHIELEVIEIDYERAAFKVRARLRGSTVWYEWNSLLNRLDTGQWYSVAGFNFIYMATY
jgi:hypothetical protein